MLKPVKIGDVVRHPNHELGVGEVIDVTNDNIEVRFAQRTVKLKAAVALPLLEPAAREDLPVATRPKTRGRSTSTASAGRCEACGKVLNRSQRSRDGKWKSCPKCSSQDGVHHVYYEYPDAFGESDARVTDADPSGAQSYCAACRGRGGATSATRVLCGDPRLGGAL